MASNLSSSARYSLTYSSSWAACLLCAGVLLLSACPGFDPSDLDGWSRSGDRNHGRKKPHHPPVKDAGTCDDRDSGEADSGTDDDAGTKHHHHPHESVEPSETAGTGAAQAQ